MWISPARTARRANRRDWWQVIVPPRRRHLVYKLLGDGFGRAQDIAKERIFKIRQRSCYLNMARRLFSIFTSLRLTVTCLIAALVLVFVGTLAQVDLGLYAAQSKILPQFFVYWNRAAASGRFRFSGWLAHWLDFADQSPGGPCHAF